MDPFTAIIGAVGLATSAFGLFEQSDAKSTQADIINQQAGVQKNITNVQNKGYKEQANAQKAISKLSLQLEGIRKSQVQLESVRQTREVIRQAQLARATAVNRAANSGSLTSSGLQGVEAQITSGSADQQSRIFGDLQKSNQVFGINRQIFNINSKLAVQGSNRNAQIAGLQGQLSDLQGASAIAQGQQDFGKSLFSTGLAITGGAKQASDVLQTIPTLFG